MIRIIVTIYALVLVLTGLGFAQQDTTIIAYDNGPGGGGIATSPGGQVAVRFTPGGYPATLLAIQVYWTNGSHPHAPTVAYSIWTSPDGAESGPINQVVSNEEHTVENRPGFETIDLSFHNVVIESGDFFCSIIQPGVLGLGLDFDQGIPSAERSWFSEDDGSTWVRLDKEPNNFPHNLVIRAVIVTDQATAVAEEITPIPHDYILEQNYPNPFNPETEIYFQLPGATQVAVTIFNTRGREIRRLVDGNYAAGYHSIRWNGMDNQGNPVSSGVYLYQLRTSTFSQVRKMSLMR